MAHELETINGRTAFATARVPAWHQLGTVTTDCMTASEVITTALLGGWNVRKIPVTGTTDYLGVVGRDYAPVQNEACAELLDLLADAAGAHFETAGSLREGRRIFITLRMPDGIRIAGIDDLDLYLAVSTSHDGSMALRVDATPVRVVCANTQRLSLKRSVGYYTFRHTTNIKTKIAQARQAIGISYSYADAFTTDAERMLDTALAEDAFRAVCEQIWPTPPADAPARTRTNHRRRTATLDYLFTDAPTQANIRGTTWAGWQAITEYVDFYAPAPNQSRRAERTLSSATVTGIKQKAHDLLTPTRT